MAKSILVVEDEEGIRNVMRECLTMMGFEVLVASDGEEALEVLANTSPSPGLIFLDVSMPRLDGWGFRTRQRADPKFGSIPVVVVTADGHAETKAQKMGVDAGLKKPIEFDTLIETARRFCG